MANIRIAFVGKPASGQITAADHLKKKYNFKRVRMIDGINRLCKMFYYKKGYERTPWEKRRSMYDALYKIDPNIFIGWIKFKMRTTTFNVVIDDAKYINEVQGLKEAGFTIVRINTNTKYRAKSIGRYLGKDIIPGTVTITEYFNKDATEILQVDYSIYHDGDRNSLRRSIDELMTKFDTEGNLIP